MNEIKAIIVDDEEAARNILENLLNLSFPHVINIVAKKADLPSAVIAIKEFKPQVVFLDIEMPKFAGYQITEFIEDIDFHIVFVTAYDKYAIKAFDVNALDYLLKPIERSRLNQTIKKIENLISEKSKAANYHELLKELQGKKDKSIVLGESNKRHVIKLSEILGVEADGPYSYLYLKNNSKLTFSKNLGYFEDLLKEEKQFFRSHKSWLINRNYIKNYSIGKLQISLPNDIVAKLSRLKKSEFERIFRDK